MSAAIVPPRITVEEFLQRPEREDGMREELIDGEIIVSPGVKPLHTDIAEYLHRKLIPLEDTGLWVVRLEVPFRLTKYSLPSTDVCVIEREVWKVARANREYATTPGLAVEVKSPSNTPPALRKKAALYLDHGAREVWIVQPDSRTVAVKTPEGDERTVSEDGTLRFENMEISVKGIFTV